MNIGCYNEMNLVIMNLSWYLIVDKELYKAKNQGRNKVSIKNENIL
jgi:hypothetical protein